MSLALEQIVQELMDYPFEGNITGLVTHVRRIVDKYFAPQDSIGPSVQVEETDEHRTAGEDALHQSAARTPDAAERLGRSGGADGVVQITERVVSLGPRLFCDVCAKPYDIVAMCGHPIKPVKGVKP